MPLLGWIRCLICSALLFSSNPSEPASGTQATDQHRLPVSIDETGSFLCSCSDKKGRTYNLASLAKRDGNPRFTVQAKDNYSYSFNPCFSFKLGSFGDCSGGNVAVCRWTNTSYEKIGDQGKGRCVLPSNGTPKFEYSTEPSSVWLSVVHLQCDRTRKSVESAEFLVTDDTSPHPVKFLLKHYCACPNACPDETPTHIGTTTPASDLRTFVIPGIVSASVVFFICVACIAIKRSISGRGRRRPHTPPIPEEDEHTGGHNSAGALSQTEESSGGDVSEYFTAPSTITSVQDEPLSMTDPAVACKNNNTNKEIQGPVRKDSHETEEAKV